MIQWREMINWKNKEAVESSLSLVSRMIRALGDTPLIINQCATFAKISGAAGVHLNPRTSVSYTEARKLLGSQAIIGTTFETWDDVVNAEKFDYTYCGLHLYPSPTTKPHPRFFPWHDVGLRAIRSYSSHHLMPIGGITPDNAAHVWDMLNEDDSVAWVSTGWRGDSEAENRKMREIYHRSKK